MLKYCNMAYLTAYIRVKLWQGHTTQLEKLLLSSSSSLITHLIRYRKCSIWFSLFSADSLFGIYCAILSFSLAHILVPVLVPRFPAALSRLHIPEVMDGWVKRSFCSVFSVSAVGCDLMSTSNQCSPEDYSHRQWMLHRPWITDYRLLSHDITGSSDIK